jgi:hypothetical protein
MSTPSHQHAAILAPLETLCRQVRRRLRAQHGARLAARWGAPTLGLCGLAVLLHRLRWIDLGSEAVWIGGALSVTFGAAVFGLSRPVSILEAARRLDQAGGLFDRLGSAWAFSKRPTQTPLQQAAILDAGRFVAKVAPHQAAPWALPQYGGHLLVAVLVLCLATAVVVPAPSIPGQALMSLTSVESRERSKPRLTEADKRALSEERARLEVEAARAQDPRVSRWISELNELLRALHDGRVTPTEAHAALAHLERGQTELAATLGSDAEALSDHAQRAAKKTRSGRKRALNEALQALRAKHWREAAEAMERLASRVEKGELSRRERKQLGKDMTSLADRLKTERQQQRDRLKKSKDRLKRKQAKQRDRFSKRNRDRLNRAERQLDRLERKNRQAGEMRRQLERLQRGMDKAAQEILKRMAEQRNQMSASELRKAAEMLRRMSKSAEGRRQMRVASSRLIDLKELLRRASKRQQGGKGGKGDEMERFLVLAKGGKGKPSSGQGQDGQGEPTSLSLGGKGGAAIDLVMPGQGQGQGQGGPGGGEPSEGDGVGEGHDPNLLAEKTANEVQTVESHVSGRDGEGASKSRVVFAAAKKGFASREWGAVHQDYTSVVEDALDAQSIPAGKRRYVRRYFDLIRPR